MGIRHGDESRFSEGGRGCGVGCCSLGSGLIWCARVDSWQDCDCVGGEMGSGHEGGVSEMGCCEESELVCGEIEFLRRLESDFFFLTFFMVILLEKHRGATWSCKFPGSLPREAVSPVGMSLIFDYSKVPQTRVTHTSCEVTKARLAPVAGAPAPCSSVASFFFQGFLLEPAEGSSCLAPPWSD